MAIHKVETAPAKCWLVRYMSRGNPDCYYIIHAPEDYLEEEIHIAASEAGISFDDYEVEEADEVSLAQQEYNKAMQALHLAYMRLYTAKQRANQK